MKYDMPLPPDPPKKSFVLSFDSLDAAVRLLTLAEDDRQDDWTREVCRQSGEMLNELTRLVTTDHETKAAFIARVRATLKLPNDKDQPARRA
jgi:hypothetical protein